MISFDLLPENTFSQLSIDKLNKSNFSSSSYSFNFNVLFKNFHNSRNESSRNYLRAMNWKETHFLEDACLKTFSTSTQKNVLSFSITFCGSVLKRKLKNLDASQTKVKKGKSNTYFRYLKCKKFFDKSYHIIFVFYYVDIDWVLDLQ